MKDAGKTGHWNRGESLMFAGHSISLPQKLYLADILSLQVPTEIRPVCLVFYDRLDLEIAYNLRL